MIILGLGTNIPIPGQNRLYFLRRTIQLLKSVQCSRWIEVLAISPLYESEALLPNDAPQSWNHPYLNLCLLCKTELEPPLLLKKLKKIEKQIGRKNRDRWAPREIDIDILAMESGTFESPDLKIPHPSLLNRPFALFPMADLVPNWKLTQPGPFHKKTAAEFASFWKYQTQGKLPFHTHRSLLSLTEFMGILNLTPDSFSDGGQFFNPKAALIQAEKLLIEGASILDLGGESTRPGAQTISWEEEWNRINPVINSLNLLFSQYSFILSVDTYHPETAARAIAAGAHWINDVTGFKNPEMIKTVVNSQVDLVLMHSMSVPPEKTSLLPQDVNPIEFLLEWGKNRIKDLQQAGISRDRIIFDPGIGFGKSVEQTWDIFKKINQFQKLGVRLLIGHSRKSFFSSIITTEASNRDLETATLTVELCKKGVNYLRVHDVQSNQRSLKVWSQLDGIIQCQS